MATTRDLLIQQRKLLRTRMTELRSAIDKVMTPVLPIYAEIDKLLVEQGELGIKISSLTIQANELEQPKLHDLKTELAVVARAEDAVRVQLDTM